ncbi:unnamed protein product [Miscanthus lutarioriparius]|uniref:Uncharacterized protein n=1 Tax=Miscanthus lutarioriparius TaxID=422564 RepID=A0A811QBW5_9POAL|nr:unnamed protein product [Miscanthus lutarioriparius]
MAVPVARVHLKVAHAALPALHPTPPKWKMLPLLPMPCLAAILPIPKPFTKPSRADSDERWDAHKAKPASTESSASSSPRSADSVSSAGRGSSRNSAISPPKPGRADSAERWDAHKKAAIPASSSSSSSGTSSLVSSSKWPISHSSSSGERWDVHKKRCQQQAELLDDGESSSTGSGSNDMDAEEEEILWKPRAMYAGPGFAVAAPEPGMLPMPTSFLVPVASAALHRSDQDSGRSFLYLPKQV